MADTTSEDPSGPRIVVGIDGSDSSLGALRWAAQQAALTGATLQVITTWDWPTSYGWAIPFPTGYDPAEGAKKLMDESIGTTRKEFPELPIVTDVDEGHPAPILIEASNGAELLVIGSRGHGEFTGMLIGSVSEHCATNAHCPVVIYRPVG